MSRKRRRNSAVPLFLVKTSPTHVLKKTSLSRENPSESTKRISLFSRRLGDEQYSIRLYRLAPNADSLHKQTLSILFPSLPFYVFYLFVFRFAFFQNQRTDGKRRHHQNYKAAANYTAASACYCSHNTPHQIY